VTIAVTRNTANVGSLRVYRVGYLGLLLVTIIRVMDWRATVFMGLRYGGLVCDSVYGAVI
jgi:hypothetical protein